MKTKKQIEREKLEKAIDDYLKAGGKIDKKRPDFSQMNPVNIYQGHNDTRNWRRGASPRGV